MLSNFVLQMRGDKENTWLFQHLSKQSLLRYKEKQSKESDTREVEPLQASSVEVERRIAVSGLKLKATRAFLILCEVALLPTIETEPRSSRRLRPFWC